MHLIYLDESGDPGCTGSPTANYILAGLSVDSKDWHYSSELLMDFRISIEHQYGLSPAAEMHACEFLGSARSHRGLGRPERLAIGSTFLSLIGEAGCFRTFGWWIRKSAQGAVDQVATVATKDLDAWSGAGTFAPSPCKYMIIHDVMGRRPSLWDTLGFPHRVEKSFAADSASSLHLQAADFVAYALRQHLNPNRFLAAHGGRNLINRLAPGTLGWREL